MLASLQNQSTLLQERYPRHAKIVRFLISGSLAAGTNLGLLYVLTDLLKIWYLISAIFSFVAGFLVSFILQKIWTFQDTSRERVHSQAGAFFMVALTGLGVNIASLYILVDYLGVHYLMAQIIVGVFIAVANFFVYHFVIFKKPV